MVYGTVVAYSTPAPSEAGSHLGASTHNVAGVNHTVYIAVTTLVINLVVAVVLTALFRLIRLPAGLDETLPAHYLAGADDETPEPELPAATAGATWRPCRHPATGKEPTTCW